MDDLSILQKCPLWAEADEIQRRTLVDFHARCARILRESCALRPLNGAVLAPERNLFSTLFITASLALGLPREKARFYAMANQAVRALVTGCDNILDDEFKEVIAFALDDSGTKFRSVLMIMAADRVLSDIAAEEQAAGRLTLEQVTRLSSSVLAVLVPSGLEEHEEEAGPAETLLTPTDVLEVVHHRKTGLLFQAPLSLLVSMDELPAGRCGPVSEALRMLGLACQVLDDIQDAATDLERRQHNLLVSFAAYGTDLRERELVEDFLAGGDRPAREVVTLLAEARHASLALAGSLFREAESGLTGEIPGFTDAHARALATAVASGIYAGSARALRREAQEIAL